MTVALYTKLRLHYSIFAGYLKFHNQTLIQDDGRKCVTFHYGNNNISEVGHLYECNAEILIN